MKLACISQIHQGIHTRSDSRQFNRYFLQSHQWLYTTAEDTIAGGIVDPDIARLYIEIFHDELECAGIGIGRQRQ